jgi:DUF1365 family protein
MNSSARTRPLASAVYEGTVRHRRHAPQPHGFSYRMAQLYLDLDEIDTVFRQRWLWSVDRPNLGAFHRRDYLGPPERGLADAARDRVQQVLGRWPAGPVRLLTHPRYAGYVFNPVSFYYCFEPGGDRLDSIVAEITNTPWKERHSYVLGVDLAERHGRALHWRFDKRFHVSPFMAMQREYDWRFTPPADDLHVHMRVLDGGQPEFEADVRLCRRPLDAAALRRVLWRYPLMTAQVIGAIHWQALQLWLKRTPVHDHPKIEGGTS